jgi:hypothetical protein
MRLSFLAFVIGLCYPTLQINSNVEVPPIPLQKIIDITFDNKLRDSGEEIDAKRTDCG